jgi:hypothetical protein
MERMARIHQTWKKNASKSTYFYDKFQQLAKNIEGSCFFSYFHIYAVAKSG